VLAALSDHSILICKLKVDLPMFTAHVDGMTDLRRLERLMSF